MSELPAAIGRYEIQAFIARGGMGTLYLASDPVLQRQVAIKLLREADNDDLRARFTREARSAANLRHRNIVTIFDVGDHHGQPFMAMEYVQGHTFSSLIDSDPPPSIIRRLQLIEELCDGLAYAHKRGVVHRDIKPANLMVDTEGALKILDFGIARAAAEAGMTQAGFLVGTLNYMSPEQVAGGAIDGRSDMFAVGAVLYELLAKRQAFPGAIDGGVLNRILNGEPEPLETICPHIEPAVYRIVRRALAKPPADRYPDLQQMRAELMQVRQGLEASAFGELEQTIAARADPDATSAAPRTARRGTDREELARRRSQQIDECLASARRALEDGHADEAIAQCEQALLLDPNDSRAFDLAERARAQRDEAHARAFLEQARESFRQGSLTLASSRVREALTLTPDSADAIELGRVIGEARLAQDRERQRTAAAQALVDRGRDALDRGDLDAALAACNEALALVPGHAGATELSSSAQQASAQREQERRDEAARQASADARSLFAQGRHADALALLEQFSPAHPLVSQAWTQLSAEAARLAGVPATPDDGAATVFVPRTAPDRSAPQPDQAQVRGPAPVARQEPARPAAAATAAPVATPSPARPPAPERTPPPARPAMSWSQQPVTRYAAAAVLVLVVVAGLFVALRGPDSSSAPELVADGGSSPTQPDGADLDPRIAQNGAPINSDQVFQPGNDAPPPPTPPIPQNAGEPSQRVLELRAAVSRALGRGDQRTALSSALAGLKVDPSDPGLLDGMKQILGRARGDALNARGAIGPGGAAAPSFADGNEALENAQSMAQAERYDAAIQSYWRAGELFARAGSEADTRARIDADARAGADADAKARAEADARAKAEADAKARADADASARAEADRAKTEADARAQAQQAAAGARGPAQPSDDQLVRQTLAAYAAAYRAMNVEAVMLVYPSSIRQTLVSGFEQMSSQEMRIDNVQITFNAPDSPTRATVRCRVYQRFNPKAGRDSEREVPTTFQLQKNGGTWVITNRQ